LCVAGAKSNKTQDFVTSM